MVVRRDRTRRALGQLDPIPTGRITALHERRSGSARYSVFVDGREVATVSAQVIADLGLRAGHPVSEALAEALHREAGHLAVFDKAVELLAVRGRSERELRLRLMRAGAVVSAVDHAVQQLSTLGLIDDERFARQVAHARVVGGGISKRRLGQELQRRGVSREMAQDAIEATLEEVPLDEVGAARAAAEKRMRGLRGLDPATRRRRVYGFLARRGYDHDVITRALKSVGAGGAFESAPDAVDDETGDDETD